MDADRREYRDEWVGYWAPGSRSLTVTFAAISDSRAWYGAAVYHATRRLDLGTYFSWFIADWSEDQSAPDNHVYDRVVTTRIDLNDLAYVKIEGHCMNGYGAFDSIRGFYGQQNRNGLKANTNALVVRTASAFRDLVRERRTNMTTLRRHAIAACMIGVAWISPLAGDVKIIAHPSVRTDSLPWPNSKAHSSRTGDGSKTARMSNLCWPKVARLVELSSGNMSARATMRCAPTTGLWSSPVLAPCPSFWIPMPRSSTRLPTRKAPSDM
jgi:hypothetical protein